MLSENEIRMYSGRRSNVARNGIAVASAIALSVSGCDSNGPGIVNQPVESDDLSDSRLTYREGGVVLSKRASDELADFVAATRFDAVLPMSIRLHAMSPNDREGFFKRLDAARRDVEAAAQRVKNAGDEVSRGDLARLDAANRRIESVMRVLLREEEQKRSRERAGKLIEKYPILADMSRDQVRQVLLQAMGSVAKNRLDPTGSVPSAVEVDTSDGDSCKTDCSIEYILDFAVTEIGTGAALFGCSLTTVAYLGCIGWALAAQWTKIAHDTYAFYSCTKKCG